MTDSEREYLLEIEKKAQQGDAMSQCYLGMKYTVGDGVEKDLTKAIDWFTKSAIQGVAEAQLRLGIYYMSRKGPIEVRKHGIEWIVKAADQGHEEAKEFLSKEVFLAAEKGDTKAQSLLSTMYFKGLGVPQDNSKGQEWFDKALDNGDDGCQFAMGNVYKKSQNYIKAGEWFLKSAEQGNDEAQYELGLLYYEGHGVLKNNDIAAEWLLKAAEQGNKDAKKFLETNEDIKIAVEKIKKKIQLEKEAKEAAEKKAREEKEAAEKKALEEKEAAERKEREEKAAAEKKTREEKEALENLQKKAEQGDINSQFELGLLYFNGKGVDKDIVKAKELISKAAEKGNKKAQDYLSTERKNKKAKNISAYFGHI